MSTLFRISFPLSTTTPDSDCFELLRALYGLGYKVRDFTLTESNTQSHISLLVGTPGIPTHYASYLVNRVIWFYRPCPHMNLHYQQVDARHGWTSQLILRTTARQKPLQPYETNVPSEHMRFIRLRQATRSISEAVNQIAWRGFTATIHHIHERTYFEWRRSTRGTQPK